MRVPFSLHSSQTSGGGGVFDDSYSNRSKNPCAVLICISLMARAGEHFFMSFLAIWTSSFEKVLHSSVAHFFVGSLVIGEFSLSSSLYILVISRLSDIANIFSHSVGGHLKLETIFFFYCAEAF
jgi:hypothetical protein